MKFTATELRKLDWLANADRGWAAALVVLAGQFATRREAWRAVRLDRPVPYFDFSPVLDCYWSSTERYLLQFAAHLADGKTSVSMYDALQYLDSAQFKTLTEAMQTFRGSRRFGATELRESTPQNLS